MEGLENLKIVYLVVVLFFLVFILETRWNKIFESFCVFVGFVYLITWMSFCMVKKIKRHLFVFFNGEEVILLDIIVISILKEKRPELPGKYPWNYDNITDHYLKITGSDYYYVFILPDEKKIYPGVKISIVCKKYWFDDKVLYFEKFL